jgi:hypothetical protein
MRTSSAFVGLLFLSFEEIIGTNAASNSSG